MAGEDIIMIRQGELKRLHVIQKVLERVIKQVEAAEILLLSGRQIRRIVKRIRCEGGKGSFTNREGGHPIGGHPIRLRTKSSDFIEPSTRILVRPWLLRSFLRGMG